MLKLISQLIIGDTFKSISDNVLSKTVVPVRGSIVYCQLGPFNSAEHSGVYVGDGQIIHLNGKGKVEKVNFDGFTRDKLAISIYVSCDLYGNPVGGEYVVSSAESWLGSERDYNVKSCNCHMFSSSCLSGAYDDDHWTLGKLKSEAELFLEAQKWLCWDLKRKYE
jgi:hypothetical protein